MGPCRTGNVGYPIAGREVCNVYPRVRTCRAVGLNSRIADVVVGTNDGYGSFSLIYVYIDEERSKEKLNRLGGDPNVRWIRLERL